MLFLRTLLQHCHMGMYHLKDILILFDVNIPQQTNTYPHAAEQLAIEHSGTNNQDSDSFIIRISLCWYGSQGRHMQIKFTTNSTWWHTFKQLSDQAENIGVELQFLQHYYHSLQDWDNVPNEHVTKLIHMGYNDINYKTELRHYEDMIENHCLLHEVVSFPPSTASPVKIK